MRNYIQAGDTIEVTAPSSSGNIDVVSGAVVLVGSVIGVAVADAEMGDPVQLKLTGVFELPKATGTAWAVGDKIYWDFADQNCNKSSSGNSLLGICTEAAISGAEVGKVRLNGISL